MVQATRGAMPQARRTRMVFPQMHPEEKTYPLDNLEGPFTPFLCRRVILALQTERGGDGSNLSRLLHHREALKKVGCQLTFA